MNVGYYGVVFDFATDAWFRHVALGREDKDRAGTSTFALEAHFTYQREVLEGEALAFTTQLLGFDEKRIHYFHAMRRGSDGALAATNELLSLHVSRQTRRASPMAAPVLARLGAVKARHDTLGPPAEAGRVIGLRPRPSRA